MSWEVRSIASRRDDPPFGLTSLMRASTRSGNNATASSARASAYICFTTLHAAGAYLIAAITTDPATKTVGHFCSIRFNDALFH